KCC
ncbi:alanine symporter family protein, partial [Vibrio parahaemolyticus VP2007-007]